MNIFDNLRREININKNVTFRVKFSLLTYRISYIQYHFTSNGICKFVLKVLYVFLRIIAMFLGCNDFPPKQATIGFGLRIPHGFSGTNINERCQIGENCTLFHGVTLGVIEEKQKQQIIIGNNVYIGAYAMILGNSTIGDNCKIGAGTKIINYKIPDNSTTVSNVELRIIKH